MGPRRAGRGWSEWGRAGAVTQLYACTPGGVAGVPPAALAGPAGRC